MQLEWWLGVFRSKFDFFDEVSTTALPNQIELVEIFRLCLHRSFRLTVSNWTRLQSKWKSNGQYCFHDKIKIVSEFLSVDSLWFKPYTKQVLKQHRREDICQKRLCFSKVNMTKSFSIDLFSTLAECPSGRLPVYRSWDLDLTAERSDKITQSTSLE